MVNFRVMQHETPITPLLALLRELGSDDKREEFAALAGTSRIYLYQLAGCYRGRTSCRADTALRIASASEAMAERYGTEPITVEALASMCQECR